MRAPLWLNVELHGSTATVELATCRNCGKTKVSSNPCGFDHLAAVMEFNAYMETSVTSPGATCEDHDGCGWCPAHDCAVAACAHEHVTTPVRSTD